MSATTERVGALVAPVLERMSLRLYDVDAPGPTLRVMVDRDGGVDIDTLAEATREISRLLDDSEPVAGSYTLEVSSPGLERPLRTPQHFEGAVGEQVRIKLLAGTQGDRRCEGTLVSVAVDAITVETPEGPRVIDLADVSKARTVFDWSTSSRASTTEPLIESTTESTTESEEDI